MFKIYVFASLVYGVVLTVLCVQLCAIKIPYKKETYKLRLARRMLSLSYLILSIPAFFEFVKQEGYEDPKFVQIYTLIAIAYEAILFTATLLTMINPKFVTAKRVTIHLILTTLLSVIFTVAQFIFESVVVYYVAMVMFFIQLSYYVMRYRKKHAEGIRQIEQYYDEDLKENLRWTQTGFYAAVAVCVIATVSALLPFQIYIILAIGYLIFYGWFANRFLNYVARVNYYIPALVSSDVPATEPVEIEISGMSDEEIALKKENLKKEIDSWIAAEKYTVKEESKENIAKELGTDPMFLVWYFRNEIKQNFRPWRVELRISLAKRLLHAETFNMSMNELAERVGFTTKSNFYGQFKKLTGVTPVEYQKNISEKHE